MDLDPCPKCSYANSSQVGTNDLESFLDDDMHVPKDVEETTMPVAAITGKLRRRIWTDLGTSLGLGVMLHHGTSRSTPFYDTSRLHGTPRRPLEALFDVDSHGAGIRLDGHWSRSIVPT
ncbi:5400_t:CDS:2 [Acaulospora colombiana]|uniref:5400_t:CDS:1 n=1 Tax=Acaulospora colombiana TaxID=27376 RepID=A0ACA9MCK3_9GLOM|nr:5400_t:CDS:2 [Acaulospora colombiana]